MIQFCFFRLVAYILGPVLNFLLGLKISLRDEGNFTDGGCILVANHQSVLDFQGAHLFKWKS